MYCYTCDEYIDGHTCPQCGQIAYNETPTLSAGVDSSPLTGSEKADVKGDELRAAFRIMEREQREEYEDYVRRCGGVPISTIKP